MSGQQHTPAALYHRGKDPVPIVQEAGWAQGTVWTGGKSHPHRDSITGRPARSSVAIPTELPGPHIHINKTHNVRVNLTLTRVRVTDIVVEKRYVLNGVCVNLIWNVWRGEIELKMY